MANIFDPQKFFESTAYYASQGRSLFTFGEPPAVLGGLRTDKNPTESGLNDFIKMGWEILQGGLMARAVDPSGYSLATYEEFSYIGPTRKHPHTQIFGPIKVDFLLAGKTIQESQALLETFLTWHEKIAGPRFSQNEADKIPRSDSTGFAIEYYDNFTTTAELKVYSPQDSTTPIIWNQYLEIYPQALSGLSTAWESSDAPLTLSVTFEFFYTTSLLTKSRNR